MSLLLIVADSLRADALGCFGGPATPVVDGLTQESLIFPTTISSAAWTVPSLGAMGTGVYAHRLGLAKWEQPWPAEALTLFDIGRAAGLEVASFVFDPRYLFCAEPRAAVAGSSQDTPALLSWIRSHRSEPFLLLVHYWWTHIPYVARAMGTRVWRRVTDQVLAALQASPASREGVKGLYRHAVQHFSERWLPAVLDEVDLDRTFVVITADHGESFGDREGPESVRDVFDLHGNSLHDEVLRVPLILRPPGGCRGRRVGGLARTVDLMPTVAELLGRADDLDLESLDGQSLASCLQGDGPAPAEDALSVMSRDVLRAPRLPSDPGELWTGLALTTATGKKLIWHPREGRRSVFDLRHDPGETLDLATTQGEELAEGWERLRRELERARVGEMAQGDAELLRERLRALGYLS